MKGRSLMANQYHPAVVNSSCICGMAAVIWYCIQYLQPARDLFSRVDLLSSVGRQVSMRCRSRRLSPISADSKP